MSQFRIVKFWQAIETEMLEEVKRLVEEEGYDVNMRSDDQGSTPLIQAAAKDSVEIVKYLVSQGANINGRDNDDWTPLHYAAGRDTKGNSRSIDVMNCLISLGADVNAKTNQGATPLDCADTDAKKSALRVAGGSLGVTGSSSGGGGCLVMLAILGASLTAGICGLALFVTIGIF